MSNAGKYKNRVAAGVSCYCFRARGIVSVVYSTVPSEGCKPCETLQELLHHPNTTVKSFPLRMNSHTSDSELHGDFHYQEYVLAVTLCQHIHLKQTSGQIQFRKFDKFYCWNISSRLTAYPLLHAKCSPLTHQTQTLLRTETSQGI